MDSILSGVFPDHLHTSVLQSLSNTRRAVVCGVGTALSKAFFLHDLLLDKSFKRYVYVAPSAADIPELVSSLELFDKDREITVFLPGEDKLSQQQTLLAFFHKAREDQSQEFLITTPEFAFQMIPTTSHMEQESYRIVRGENLVLRDFYERLISLGYTLSEDKHLKPGTYRVEGGNITVFPLQYDQPYRLELDGERIESLHVFSQEQPGQILPQKELRLFPVVFQNQDEPLLQSVGAGSLLISDELDLHHEEEYQVLEHLLTTRPDLSYLKITSFPEERDIFQHLQYLSVIKYYSVTDFVNDVREKYLNTWKVLLLSKNQEEIANILTEYEIPFSNHPDLFHEQERGVLLLPLGEQNTIPRSFQNTFLKIAILTDREIFRIRKKTSLAEQKTVLDFITSLKPGDYVVHNDHGIGRFLGIDKKTIDGITKEYIQIQYAGNDRLFIPTDQAAKVSRFIPGGEDHEPKLTRLDSGEWQTVNRKVKKETEKIAKELLTLYAKRKLSKGHNFPADGTEQVQFEEAFPYEETPGQLRAIKDVKEDMEKTTPMDRLVCGDVGFGKTEVAMRAIFKAISDGKQVAFISPVTILADQHYKTFLKRFVNFNARAAMMSRFQSAKEQKETLEKLEKGEVDVVIGTHRLLQEDVKFKDLGLLIIDEEQKFGVKQKEKLKEFRCNVDVLTLTATPIPRTLNLSLNKLRDITTITTPPPGRLPIITEVRKYNETLIREAILAELARKGQVYFLHNKVQTIESVADKLRFLIPEARFVVAHGQLESKDLESRVLDFKEGKFDCLVSSTIIENGIDLPNANTLIVNNADQFGLSQLYQLRGRVGRSRKQAYTYLLYAGQRLSLEAKKRLRAIVEASELGSGFQIAMKDLEIRGAGDILGANQHGVIKTVGVSHFVRMLNQTVEEMKSGSYNEEIEVPAEENVNVELPLTSYIPETFIPDYKEKIAVYQKMASMDSLAELKDLRQSIQDEYGSLPEEIRNLFKVLEVKLLAKDAGLLAVRMVNYTLQEKYLELHMSKKITPHQVMNLLKDDLSHKWTISGDKLKIAVRDLGLDWYEGTKAALTKLIEGKQTQEVEKKLKTPTGVPS